MANWARYLFEVLFESREQGAGTDSDTHQISEKVFQNNHPVPIIQCQHHHIVAILGRAVTFSVFCGKTRINWRSSNKMKSFFGWNNLFGVFWDRVFPLLSSGDKTPLCRTLDGELVDIVGGGARVHRLHHVVPQVLAHLQANYMTKECKDPYTM